MVYFGECPKGYPINDANIKPVNFQPMILEYLKKAQPIKPI